MKKLTIVKTLTNTMRWPSGLSKLMAQSVQQEQNQEKNVQKTSFSTYISVYVRSCTPQNERVTATLPSLHINQLTWQKNDTQMFLP